ncbi:RNA-binding protein 48 [Drosophila eugracilis]|uniref:RNA-binding protein 48 n=1 Tax=Drosophila eugracilis TaxID=29029 RepID=UPI0007E67978|nr:RNA-binding protein 48 [Drosophila eugracilis]
MHTSSSEHHKRLEYCTTRLQYRQGRELKAVKVYTVASESRHLLIFGVPKINLQADLKTKLQGFGKLQSCICITSEMASKMELEAFTDVFAVKFERLEVARRAKRMLDAHQFFGGILHISYAPEREPLEELREKMLQRKHEVHLRIRRNQKDEPPAAKKNREVR